MSYKKDIYKLFFKNQLLRIKSFTRSFFRGNIRYRKSFCFNIWGEKSNVLSPQEISEIAFNVFSERPFRVEFFSRSKFGLNSYKVFYKEKSMGLLRCRETFSREHAERFDKIIGILTKNKIKIPPVIARYKNLIFSPWIAGKNIRLSDFILKPLLLEKLIEYQASIHSCFLPKEFLKDKIYRKSQYLDFLTKRFIFFGSKYFETKELINVVTILKKRIPPLQTSIIHPDFTDNNIVLENGEPILIDNETLNVDLGYEYDILNAAKSFFNHSPSLQEYYLSLYKKYHSLGTLETHFDFWHLVYLVRMAGSAFQGGDHQRGIYLVKRIIKDCLKSNQKIKP